MDDSLKNVSNKKIRNYEVLQTLLETRSEEKLCRNKESYLIACKENGVVPVSYYLHNNSKRKLNMSQRGLGTLGTKALCDSLTGNYHVSHLNLSENCFGSEGCLYLSILLKENSFISTLDVSENAIGFQGMKHICNILQHTKTLKRLSLKGNGLETSSADILAKTLKKHGKCLKQLNLSHNSFGEEAGLLLASIIAVNETLEELDLSWNHIRQKGACAIGLALKENISLKKLNLSWNGFADNGIFVLSESLKVNSSLQHLDISCNRISYDGACHLRKALTLNTGLIVLKVGQNPLQHGTFEIIKAFHNNMVTTIAELHFTDIQVTKEFIDLVAKIKSKVPTLNVYHGGLGGSLQKPEERKNPMKVLRVYIKENQLRIFDFFKKLDKDKSLSLTIAEFVSGLKESGVPLRHDELVSLVQSLDIDGDGEIDYKELVLGHHAILREERHEILKEKAIQAHKEKLLLSENLTPRMKEKSETLLVRSRSKTHSFSRPINSPSSSIDSIRTSSSQSLLRRSKSSKMLEGNNIYHNVEE
ncbi:leucine-rich repeat-containing protein 74B isoform X1 [Hydra vulgaris]|uniref:leucine-rich repeat-containing protein 74B isoform X1 n=1 Tax=Hydra vulgaris TaxID=6087 RepID=UPI0006410730|nr:leucine-rich repeat-containing protein 74B isoform X2 [Hydra vulgaris]